MGFLNHFLIPLFFVFQIFRFRTVRKLPEAVVLSTITYLNGYVNVTVNGVNSNIFGNIYRKTDALLKKNGCFSIMENTCEYEN